MELKDIDIAKKLYKKWQDKQPDMQKRCNYYIGKTDIDTTYNKSKLGCNRIVKVPFISKFINDEVTFGTANDITLVHKKSIVDIANNVELDEESKEIQLANAVMRTNNSNINAELMKNLLVFGEAMELYYTINAKDLTNVFKIKELNPLNCYVELDTNKEVTNALYVVKVNDEVQIQYFNATNIIIYTEDFDVIQTIPHYFNCVPVGYCSLIDGVYSTLFNNIKTLQDNIENVFSDLANEIGFSKASYLILRNMGLTEAEIKANFTDKKGNVNMEGVTQQVIKNFRDNGILLIEDSKDTEAKAEFLNKEINVEAHKSFLEKVTDITYQVAQHINLNEKISSNSSGVMLQTRIICLRNKVKIQQNCMTQAIKKRLKCMFYRLNQVLNTELDSNRIEVKYSIAVPSDDTAMADIINKLYGQNILTGATALNQLSFINDGAEEYRKAQEEKLDRDKSEIGLEQGIKNEEV